MAGDSLAAADLGYRSDITAATSGSNSTGGKLWLPIWAGEVINAYDEYNMFEPLVTSRTITSGTTVEFPITGTVDLEPNWDAGQELVGGTNSTATTFTIALDKRPMAAHFELDNVDLMLTQWEYRSELARQAAMTLANARDKQIYSMLVQTACSDPHSNDPRTDISEAQLDTMLYGDSETVEGTYDKKLSSWGDNTAAAADRATGALSALEAIEKYIVSLQEMHIPYGNLYLACSPQSFMDIRALGVAREDSDLDSGGRRPYFGGTADMGGLGEGLRNGFSKLHDSLEYMGCRIIKSNHVIEADTTTATMGEAKYAKNFGAASGAGVKGIMWIPEAVAALRLQGLKVDTVDDVRRNTTFTVASMMNGTGILRPECAAIITSLSTTAETTPDVAGNQRGLFSALLDA